MKVINRRDFIKLKAPVLFSEFEPCVFGPLSIKYQSYEFDSGGNDYCDVTINSAIKSESSFDFSNKCFDMEEKNISVDVDLETATRDGMFNYDQMYAIWENKDIDKLISKLKECKQQVKNENER